jgi:hypothetical protein
MSISRAEAGRRPCCATPRRSGAPGCALMPQHPLSLADARRPVEGRPRSSKVSKSGAFCGFQVCPAAPSKSPCSGRGGAQARRCDPGRVRHQPILNHDPLKPCAGSVHETVGIRAVPGRGRGRKGSRGPARGDATPRRKNASRCVTSAPVVRHVAEAIRPRAHQAHPGQADPGAASDRGRTVPFAPYRRPSGPQAGQTRTWRAASTQ